MTTEHNINNNNNNDEDHFPVNLDISSGKSDIDLLEVFEASDSVGFRFIDYQEN
jgi:hypothetical protein